MLVALLLAAAIALSLQAQMLNSPLCAAWLLPFLAAIAIAVYRKGGPPQRGVVWWGALAWLIALGLSTFFISPIPGAAATMWILAAAPILSLCLRAEHINACAIGALAVLAIYAVGLIAQETLDIRYTTAWERHSGRSWPVLDANNAAAILNFGLIGSFWMMIKK